MKAPFRSDLAGLLVVLTFAAGLGVLALAGTLALKLALQHLTR